FTEKAAAELKDRILSLVQASGHSTTGLAEMYVGTMHGYCLDLLQRHVPQTFKMNVLTEITSRMFIDRYSKASGLTSCPVSTPAGTARLRRYVDSRLYQSALGILSEDDVNLEQVPEGVLSSQAQYLNLL